MKKVLALCLVLIGLSPFAFAQTVVQGASSEPLIMLGFWPRVSIPSPLDTNASLFAVGGGGKITGEYVLPSVPLLFANAAIDYGYSPLAISGTSMALSLFTASAGIGIQYPLTNWVSLRGLASAGYYFGFENSTGLSHSDGNAFVAAGLGASFRLGLPVVLGFETAYKLYANLEQTIDVSVGVSYGLLSRPARSVTTTTAQPAQPQPTPPAAPPAQPQPTPPVQPAQPVQPKQVPPVQPQPAQSAKPQPVQPQPAQPQPVQPLAPKPVPLKVEPQQPVEEVGKGLIVKNLAFENVFPVFQPYYDDHPIGKFTLKNTELASATGITVTFQVKELMDAPKKCTAISELKAGESKAVDLYALFKASILDITEPTKVAAEIAVSYMMNGKTVSQSESETLRIFDRNAMMWDDNRKAAAFVTAKEPAVLTFSNNINALIKPTLNHAVDQNLQTAIALHDALRLYGISYVSNPLTSYAVVSKDKLAVDTLKFPRQTFEYRSGDCSDLTLLYCALMESVQIETSFITIPGHIFMAFALKSTPEEARANFAHPDELIFRNDKVWIPIEVTEREGTFLSAWQQGAKEWRENLSVNQADFYPVHEAWKVYEPVGLRGTGSPPALPDSVKLLADFQNDVSRHVELQIYAKVAALQAAVTKSKESPKSLNSLGVLYARYDLVVKAESAFKRALEKSDYVPALVNMGNLAFLNGDMEKALSFYERAYKKAPLEPAALVGMARASQELEDYRTAKKTYEELKKVAPRIAEQFAYLELRGEESTRAAEISGVKEMVLWAEE